MANPARWGQGQGKRETLSDLEKKLRGLLLTQDDGVWDLGSREVEIMCQKNRLAEQLCRDAACFAAL